MPNRTCVVCGVLIDSRRRPGTIYCTHACTSRAHRQRVTSGEVPDGARVCMQCSAPIGDRRRDARYCSKNCASLHHYYRTKAIHDRPRRSCPVCDSVLPLTANANRVFCSLTCRNVHRTVSSHGLTMDEYRAMLAEQGGACAICGGDEQWKPDDRGWHIDHDHETGKVRGVLCPPCNLMLGYAKDRTSVLRAGAEYIERTKSPQPI